MKRVLFLGAGTMGWRTMAKALQQFSDEGYNFEATHVEHTNVTLLRSFKPNGLVRSVSHRIDWRFKRHPKKLAALLKKQKYDHVHCFGHLVAAPDVFAKYGVTYSVTTDGTWYQNTRELHKPKNRVDKARCRRRIQSELDIFAEAQHISCTSDWARHSVVEELGFDVNKVSVEPFPIIDRNICTDRSEADWITFIGNDFARKGGDLLLEAYKRGLNDHSELHIISSAEPPKNLSEIDGVIWHGPVSNDEIRKEILPKTRVLALPTWVDQSPLVLAEAAASGVPVVASAIAGIGELVQHDKTGFLVKPGDVFDLKKKLECVLTDDELAASLGIAAREHYEAKLRANHSIDRLFDIVQDCASRLVIMLDDKPEMAML